MKKTGIYEVNGRRPALFQLGLVVALSTTLVAFEWRTFNKNYAQEHPLEVEQPMQIEPLTIIKPRKKVQENAVEKKKVNTLAPPKVVLEPIEVEPDKKQAFDPNLLANNLQDTMPDEGGEGEDPNKLWVIVEEMPHYNSCYNILDPIAQQACTDEQVLKHVGKHLKYPRSVLDKGIGGRVYLSYVVNKHGQVVDAKVEQGIHPDLDKEALRVVKSIPAMNPGKQRGRPVDVVFNIPIKFSPK